MAKRVLTFIERLGKGERIHILPFIEAHVNALSARDPETQEYVYANREFPKIWDWLGMTKAEYMTYIHYPHVLNAIALAHISDMRLDKVLEVARTSARIFGDSPRRWESARLHYLQELISEPKKEEPK